MNRLRIPFFLPSLLFSLLVVAAASAQTTGQERSKADTGYQLSPHDKAAFAQLDAEDRMMDSIRASIPDIPFASRTDNQKLIKQPAVWLERPASYPEPFSSAFIDCANEQLTPFFEKTMALRVNRLVELVPGDSLIYRKGPLSSLQVTLVLAHVNSNPIIVAWKSISGKVYAISDTSIDRSDIRFMILGADPLIYHEQLFPKDALPFDPGSLSYQLVVHRLNMDMEITLTAKKGMDMPETEKQLLEMIGRHNDEIMQHNSQEAPLHHFSSKREGSKIVLSLDTGFSGPPFLKYILTELSKMNAFDKVEVGEDGNGA